MKNSWLVWIFVVGVIVTVFVAFNYEKGKNAIPLSEIFKEEQSMPVDVEYEIVQSEGTQAQGDITMTAPATPAEPKLAQKPAKPAAQAPAQIVLEAPQTKESNTSSPAIDFSKVPFTIQVASFKEQSKAQKILDTLKSKGYAGQIVARNLGDQGIWNRVYVGQFNAKSEADAYLQRIQSDFQGKITGFVISPQKAK